MENRKKQPIFIDMGKQGFDELTEFTIGVTGKDVVSSDKFNSQEKQIEEMAKTLYDYCFSYDDCVEGSEENLAKFLIEHGYRKIAEDSVVLSKKEYEEYQDLLKNFDNYLFEYRKFADKCIEHKGTETAEKWHYHITTTLLALWKGNKITTEIYNSWISFFNDLAKQFGIEKKE